MDGFAVTDMIEFIGVLSVDPSLAHVYDENRYRIFWILKNWCMSTIIMSVEVYRYWLLTGITWFNRLDGLQNSIEGYEEPMEERSAHAPPPSLVPRLHVIIHHKLKHNNPHVPTEKEKIDTGRR